MMKILEFNKEIQNLVGRIEDRKTLIKNKKVKKDSPIQISPKDLFLIMNFDEMKKDYKQPTSSELKSGNFGKFRGINLRCS